MHLHDLIAPADLTAGLEAKLINIREDGDGQRILNYSDAALYTPAWDNPAVRQCRGLIVDEFDRIIARPWAKFFNYGQAEAGTLDLDAPVQVTDKVDGSLGIIHLDNDGAPRVATRGSFQSDQAIHATQVLRDRYDGLGMLHWYTPLVEIVYPANRIVVDYGDLDDLILLGGVHINTGAYVDPDDMAEIVGWTGPITETFDYPTLRDALAAPPRPGMEGLCVRFTGTEHIVKVKQEDYVRLHRIVTGLSERSVWEHMTAGLPLGDLLSTLPDELHDWTRQVWDDLDTALWDKQTSAVVAHRSILRSLGSDWTRKDYALAAANMPTLRPYLFNLLDGRDPAAAILRTLKPAGDTRARAYSEDVA